MAKCLFKGERSEAEGSEPAGERTPSPEPTAVGEGEGDTAERPRRTSATTSYGLNRGGEAAEVMSRRSAFAILSFFAILFPFFL